LKILLTAILVTLCTALVVGVTTLAHLNTYKRDIGKLTNELAATKERLERLERNAPPSNSSFSTAAAPAPFETRRKEPLLTFSTDDIAVIRSFIKLPPPSSAAAPTIALGDIVPEARLLAVPDAIVEKVPKLRGARFTSDRNNAIVVVGRGGNRADMIISPN
jgi:hypothetical protein